MYQRIEIIKMLGIDKEDFRRVKRTLGLKASGFKGNLALYSDAQIGKIIRHFREYQPYLLKNYKKPIDPNKNESEIQRLEREIKEEYSEEKQRQLHLLRAKEKKKYPSKYVSVSVNDQNVIR